MSVKTATSPIPFTDCRISPDRQHLLPSVEQFEQLRKGRKAFHWKDRSDSGTQPT